MARSCKNVYVGNTSFQFGFQHPWMHHPPLEDVPHTGTAETTVLPAGDMQAANLPQLLFAKHLRAHHEPKARSSFFYLLLYPPCISQLCPLCTFQCARSNGVICNNPVLSDTDQARDTPRSCCTGGD